MTKSGTLSRRALGAAAFFAAAAFLTQPAAAQNKEPIVIGGTLGLTGAYAEPSTDYKAVYDLWLEKINKKGGLLGRPVKMIIYNDESTPTVAQALYNRLLDQDKVDLVLAPYTTFVGGSIVPIVRSHNKVLFNGGFVGINIFNAAKGWIVGSYNYQEPDYTRGVFELIKSLPENERPKRVAIFTAQNPFTLVVRTGVDGKGGALNFAKDLGMDVVVDEQYPPNTTDFTGLVQKAKNANADVVLALSLPNDALQIARTVAQQGYKPSMFCTCGSQVTTLKGWAALGEAADRGFGTTIAWPTQPFAGIKELGEIFQKRGYATLPTYAIGGTAILEVLEQAVEGAKTLDQQKLKDYIQKTTFKTVGGDFKYQENGTPEYSQIILQYQKGKNEVVWPKQYRTAEPVLK
jgi:branched-chain amino acid transport system substrate-binding protein